MNVHLKPMSAIKLDPKSSPTTEPLKAYDPIVLENVGGEFRLRKADPMTEAPHAILNSDFTLTDDRTAVNVPSWWFRALVQRYNAEHAKG